MTTPADELHAALPADELRAAARTLRETSGPGWFLDLAHWLERVARRWPSGVPETSTAWASIERKDALATARSINSTTGDNPS